MTRVLVVSVMVGVVLLSAFLGTWRSGQTHRVGPRPGRMSVKLVSNTGPGLGQILQYLISYRGRRYFVSIETVQARPGSKPRYSLEIQRFPAPSHGSPELLRPQPRYTSPRWALSRAKSWIRTRAGG